MCLRMPSMLGQPHTLDDVILCNRVVGRLLTGSDNETDFELMALSLPRPAWNEVHASLVRDLISEDNSLLQFPFKSALFS